MVGRVGVWDGDVREASRRKKASFRFIARGIVNGGSRQSPVADTVWARDGTYLVARYDAVGTFEQLGLERVRQRAGYIGWHVVSGDPAIDGGAVMVRVDCRG
jgi:hypothetical protein